MKRSKLLIAIALGYALAALVGLIDLPDALKKDGLFVVQAFLALVTQLSLAVGFFLQRSWVVPVLLGSSAIMLTLNVIWLNQNPPEHMSISTASMVVLVLNLFPGVLVFLRRDRLTKNGFVDQPGPTNA